MNRSTFTFHYAMSFIIEMLTSEVITERIEAKKAMVGLIEAYFKYNEDYNG